MPTDSFLINRVALNLIVLNGRREGRGNVYRNSNDTANRNDRVGKTFPDVPLSIQWPSLSLLCGMHAFYSNGPIFKLWREMLRLPASGRHLNPFMILLPGLKARASSLPCSNIVQTKLELANWPAPCHFLCRGSGRTFIPRLKRLGVSWTVFINGWELCIHLPENLLRLVNRGGHFVNHARNFCETLGLSKMFPIPSKAIRHQPLNPEKKNNLSRVSFEKPPKILDMVSLSSCEPNHLKYYILRPWKRLEMDDQMERKLVYLYISWALMPCLENPCHSSLCLVEFLII